VHFATESKLRYDTRRVATDIVRVQAEEVAEAVREEYRRHVVLHHLLHVSRHKAVLEALITNGTYAYAGNG
jgi:hypothetical protein